jgi:hypothetical protein
MRGSHGLGRFDAEFEVKSIRRGISRDLQRPVGQHVDWYIYDLEESGTDPVYDVGSPSVGRVWRKPFRVPVVNAEIYQANLFQNDRGFYTVDTLRIVINFDDMVRIIPSLETHPDQHLVDRIGYRDAIFTPNRIFPRGQVGFEYMGVLVESTQVKPEEMVNDTMAAPDPEGWDAGPVAQPPGTETVYDGGVVSYP